MLRISLHRELSFHTLSSSSCIYSIIYIYFGAELYHGRLDKTPGAIAYRLRWYGAGDPKIVFFERKTHRDTWTGEASVKERFIVSTTFCCRDDVSVMTIVTP